MSSAGTSVEVAVKDMTPEQFFDHLDRKVAEHYRDLEQSAAYRAVDHPDADPRLVAGLVKWYLLEAFGYGPQISEATFTAVGRLPKDRPDLMKPMILHDLEEVDHGEMALQDYIRLGGDEHFARTRRMSPESFVVAATCRMLAERENPFSYLGYMYPLEKLTQLLTERGQELLSAKGFPAEARYFIDFHAKADVGHAHMLRNLIVRVVHDYPEAAAAIEYGFDCFRCVYPIPVWEAALRHARQELAAAGGESRQSARS